MSNSEGLCHSLRDDGLLLRLLDGELPQSEEHRVLTHLRTCHECLGLAADLLYTDTRLKELFARHDTQKDKQRKKVVDRFLLEVDKLPIGKSMGRDLLDENGTLLIAAGTEFTPGLVETLKTRGIDKLVVESVQFEDIPVEEESASPVIRASQIEGFLAEGGIEPAVSSHVRNQCLQAVGNCFKNLEDSGSLDVTEIHDSVNQVTEQILSSPQVTLTLADLILIDPGLHAHSVNVLILFLMTARAMGHPVQLIRDHSVAALLHDIGRIAIRKQGQPDDVEDKQRDEDLKHCEAGYNYLWNLGGIKDSALKMVMNHHERYDGKGYPQGLKGTALSDWDQILILANTYDSLTWNRKTGLRSGFHEALTALIEDGSKYVRKGIVRAVIQTFGQYPPGSWVKLNSGEICLVSAARPGSPLKPMVSVVYDANGKRNSKPKFIDLVHTPAHYIIGPVSVETRM
jgi:hypothetical protein